MTPQPTAPPRETVMDPRAERLGQVYAEAMADFLTTGPQAEQFAGELTSLSQTVRRTEGWAELLCDPTMGQARREAMVQRIFSRRVSEPLASLLGVMGRNNRLDAIPAVARQFRKVLDGRANRIDVTVRSAVKLSPQQQDRLRETLGETLQAEPNLHLVVDGGLLGGVVVQVGDTVYDASLAGRIKQLRTKLINKQDNTGPGRP